MRRLPCSTLLPAAGALALAVLVTGCGQPTVESVEDLEFAGDSTEQAATGFTCAPGATACVAGPQVLVSLLRAGAAGGTLGEVAQTFVAGAAGVPTEVSLALRRLRRPTDATGCRVRVSVRPITPPGVVPTSSSADLAFVEVPFNDVSPAIMPLTLQSVVGAPALEAGRGYALVVRVSSPAAGAAIVGVGAIEGAPGIGHAVRRGVRGSADPAFRVVDGAFDVAFSLSATGAEPVDECLVDHGGCSQDADCLDTPASRTCTCHAGFTGNGVTCTNVDECLVPNRCGAHATCGDLPGTFSCTCDPGYDGATTTGTEATCEAADRCALDHGGCSADADCLDLGGVLTCTCHVGFTGSGTTCVDEDECLLSGTCGEGAICTNTIGSHACSCAPGYEGAPTTGAPASCAQVNECLVAEGGCHVNAQCADTPGSFTCTCNPGYTGDGFSCTDDDECAAPGVCGANAACTNLPGSFSCACKAGFSGTSVAGGPATCVAIVVDEDQCALGHDTCDPHARCINENPGFRCTCIEGYAGNGVTCAPPPFDPAPAASCQSRFTTGRFGEISDSSSNLVWDRVQAPARSTFASAQAACTAARSRLPTPDELETLRGLWDFGCESRACSFDVNGCGAFWTSRGGTSPTPVLVSMRTGAQVVADGAASGLRICVR